MPEKEIPPDQRELRPTSELLSIARLKIHPGKLDEFKHQAARCAELVRTKGLRLFEHLGGEIKLEKIRESISLGTATLTFFAAK